MDIFDDSENLFDLHVVVDYSDKRLIIREHLNLWETKIHCCDDSKSECQGFLTYMFSSY